MLEKMFTTRQKLSLAFTCFLFLFLTIFCAVFLTVFRFIFLQDLKNDLQTVAMETLRNHTTVVDGKIQLTNDKSGISAREEFLENNTSALILGRDLNLVAGFGVFEFYSEADKDNLLALARFGNEEAVLKNEFAQKEIVWRDQKIQVIAAPVKSAGQVAGVMFVAKNLAAQDRITNIIFMLFGALSFSSLLVSFVAGNILVRKFLSPLSLLTRAIEETDIDKLDKNVPVAGHGSDELVILLKRFNEMTIRLKEMVNQQKEFAANVSHELKTPLTRAISSVEIMAMDSPKNMDSLNKVRDDLFGLNTLIDQILYLSSLNKKRVGVFPPSDLSEILAVVQSDYQKKVSEKLLRVTINLPPKVIVPIPREFAKVILTNLFSNAIKYTPNEGNITIFTKPEKMTISLVFENSGITVPPLDKKMMFERFYRGITSNRTSGHGIGLSIVKRICELYNIGYRVESDETKTRFVLLFNSRSRNIS